MVLVVVALAPDPPPPPDPEPIPETWEVGIDAGGTDAGGTLPAGAAVVVPQSTAAGVVGLTTTLPLTEGKETGWPAALQRDVAAAETAFDVPSVPAFNTGGIQRHSQDWSAGFGHALSTQPVNCPTRVGFWQWQAKSVNVEQPSLLRALMTQSIWSSVY